MLFDLDGTLIDTIGLILASFRHATSTVLGEALPDEALLHNVGVPLARQMTEFSPEHAEELVRVYREHNARYHDELAREYPGTHEALARLRDAGYPMGVVTSKLCRVAHMGLDLFDLTGFFDVVVGADDTELHKPDPFPLFHAAGLLGIPVTDCAYVGDSEHDMAAAVAAGAVAMAALWGPFPRERVVAPGPDYALASILDVPEVLAGRGEHLRVEASRRRHG